MGVLPGCSPNRPPLQTNSAVPHTSGTDAVMEALDGVVDAAMEWYDDVVRDDLVQVGASVVRQAVKTTKTELPRKRPSGNMPGWVVVFSLRHGRRPGGLFSILAAPCRSALCRKQVCYATCGGVVRRWPD